MEFSFQLPNTLPVMSLPGTIFFPHAMLPLYIFEPRYREMLEDALLDHRLLIVDGHQEEMDGEESSANKVCRVATAGMIRASQKRPDGTSHLLLQGLARVNMVEFIEEKPYRQARLRGFHTPPCDMAEVTLIKDQVWRRVVRLLERLGEKGKEILVTLKRPDDPETFLDMTTYSLCPDSKVKQQILDTKSLPIRFQLFLNWLDSELLRMKIDNTRE